MASVDTRWIVLCGFDTHIETVLGPFLTESDALLAKSVVHQMEYRDTGSSWGEGDTWVRLEEREEITL